MLSFALAGIEPSGLQWMASEYRLGGFMISFMRVEKSVWTEIGIQRVKKISAMSPDPTSGLKTLSKTVL
jgi:hypothetical protein